jgi:hypothetical protein
MEGSTGLCLTKIFTAKVSILSLSVSGMLGIVSSWRPEERERRKTEETEDRARERRGGQRRQRIEQGRRSKRAEQMIRRNHRR